MHCRALSGALAALALALSIHAPAAAEVPGELLWSVPLELRAIMTAPAVAADGTIYIHADELVAIAPDGTVLWRVPLFGIEAVDVGPDGTIYTGSLREVRAYNPDGSLEWMFEEPFGGQGIMAGPTVGPDGNIYVVTDLGGLGAFSLTPDGALRWNLPGFWDREGRGESPVAMGADRFYFSESDSDIPECPPAAGMLAAISFEGDLLWCTALTDPNRPVVAPNGNVYTSNADSEARAYTPDGDLDWFFDLPLINYSVIGPSAGPQSEAYVFQTLDDLWAIEADGSQRWVATAPQGNALHPATASADGRAVVFGAISGSPDFQGFVIARDPATSIELWATPLEGDSEGVSGPATFSSDGSVVYVPASTFTASRLVAIQVRDAGPPPELQVTVTPHNPPVVIPPQGGRVPYDLVVTNHNDAARSFDLWITVSIGASNRTLGPIARTLGPGQSLQRTLTQNIPGGAPPGTYTLTASVGAFPAAESSDSFSFEKLAAFGQPVAGGSR